MNFSFDSVKLDSKLRNEDVYHDIETPRGHFFAVLDFASHDYANLNVTLKGKLDSLVGSFASLSDFSDELFLGFVAKEANNFVTNLAEQSGDPGVLFSAAFCLVSGNSLSYLLCGDVRIILSGDSLTAPQPAASETRLGEHKMENPITDQVRVVTLNDDDLVLILTQGLAEVSAADVASFRGSDPKAISESLMKSSKAGSEDRTLLVIGGPYVEHVEAALPDSIEALPNSTELVDLRQSLASLEARLDALTATEPRKESDASALAGAGTAALEQKLSQQLDSIKDDLSSKAASIDLLEFDEKIKALNALLARKADRADVLGLQRDVLKLGLTSDRLSSEEPGETTETIPLAVDNAASPEIPSESGPVQSALQTDKDAAPTFPANGPVPPPPFFNIKTALLVVAIALVAGFVGGWLNSGGTEKTPESWLVKTSGNQIVIGRLDPPTTNAVTMNLAEPVKATGEQRFSSFADVKQYIDTVTKTEIQFVPAEQGSPVSLPTPLPVGNTPAGNTSGPVREIVIKGGDTLQKLSQAYHVSPEKLKELNPGITRWPAVRVGQKVFVPASSAPAPSPTPKKEPSPATQSADNAQPTPASTSQPAPVNASQQTSGNTTQIGVKSGDSLDKIARRFNTTTERLKELNPNISNWRRLQIRQKVVVPAPGG